MSCYWNKETNYLIFNHTSYTPTYHSTNHESCRRRLRARSTFSRQLSPSSGGAHPGSTALYSRGFPITVDGASTEETQPCKPATEPTMSDSRNHPIHPRMNNTSESNASRQPAISSGAGSTPIEDRIANAIDQVAAAYEAGNAGFSIVLHPDSSTQHATTANNSALPIQPEASNQHN